MIRFIKWFLALIILACIGGFLHYTMAQRDIVRITGTEIIRTDVSGWNSMFFAAPDSGNTAGVNRGLRLINAVHPDGQVIVYRNEDTGVFSWPPYFKVNSADLQAEAEDFVSTKATPEWVIIRHYGWRSTLFSIYPNAVSIRPATGPDQQLIPWFNGVILLILFAIFWAIFVRVKRFWDRRVEPVLDQVDARMDETRDRMGGWFRRN
ncbi:MAG: DUF1523 family protein [Pseudomonadota bacterium]